MFRFWSNVAEPELDQTMASLVIPQLEEAAETQVGSCVLFMSSHTAHMTVCPSTTQSGNFGGTMDANFSYTFSSSLTFLGFSMKD